MSTDDRTTSNEPADQNPLPVEDLKQQAVDAESAAEVKGGIVITKRTDTASSDLFLKS
jgi:hypothetical protein